MSSTEEGGRAGRPHTCLLWSRLDTNKGIHQPSRSAAQHSGVYQLLLQQMLSGKHPTRQTRPKNATKHTGEIASHCQPHLRKSEPPINTRISHFHH